MVPNQRADNDANITDMYRGAILPRKTLVSEPDNSFPFLERSPDGGQQKEPANRLREEARKSPTD